MLLTRGEVAGRLRVAERTVDRYIKAGLLKAIKAPGPNGAVRITEEAFQEYLNNQAVKPQAESA